MLTSLVVVSCAPKIQVSTSALTPMLTPTLIQAPSTTSELEKEFTVYAEAVAEWQQDDWIPWRDSLLEDIEDERICIDTDTHLQTGNRLVQTLQKFPKGRHKGSEVTRAQSVVEERLKETVEFLFEDIFPEVCRRKSPGDYAEAKTGTNYVIYMFEEDLEKWSTALKRRAGELGRNVPSAFSPMPTPTPGGRLNPTPIGESVIVDLSPIKEMAISATVLEVRRGAAAMEIGRYGSLMGFSPPVDGEDYVAVRISAEWLKGSRYEREKLFLDWHFALRFEDGTVVPPHVVPVEPIAEGYIPLSGEGWLLWRIRADSSPLLRCQPGQIIETIESRGAYMALE